MPLLVDASEATLSALMGKRSMQRAASQGAAEIQVVIDRLIGEATGSPTIVLEGIAATNALTLAIEHVDATLRRWATVYSPIQWLWMLRRIPNFVFEGSLPSTLPYDLTLATVLTGDSMTRGGGRLADRQLIYQTRELDAQRVWRFCAGVRYLSHLHQAYRWASKGAPIHFLRRMPSRPEPSEALREAVELYDLRMCDSAMFLAHSGTIPHKLEDGGNGTAIRGIFQIDPIEIPVPDLPGAAIQQVEVVARFVPDEVDLAQFIAMLLHNEALQQPSRLREIAALCCLLSSLYDLIWQHRMATGVLQRGYLLWRHERLKEALTQAFSRLPVTFQQLANRSGITSADAWARELEMMRGATWPLAPGPILRRDGGAVLLDLHFATMRLNTIMGELPQQGAAANERAQSFEMRVQTAIDASAWRPEMALGSFRGRTLRLHGKNFTDVDAIGVCAHQLLLVSCKSTLYSPQYDAGNFNAIRNRADLLTSAVNDWNQKIISLRAQPVGDNFNFSRFKNIVGVVCTPLPVFVPSELTATMQPENLGPACSFRELEQWISRGQTS